MSDSDPFAGEKKIGLPAAARLAGVNSATVWRWCRTGCRLPGGQRLRLESKRLGGRWCTSAGAVERFSAVLTEAHGGQVEEAAPVPRSPAARRRAAERAAAELEAAGA